MIEIIEKALKLRFGSTAIAVLKLGWEKPVSAYALTKGEIENLTNVSHAMGILRRLVSAGLMEIVGQEGPKKYYRTKLK